MTRPESPHYEKMLRLITSPPKDLAQGRPSPYYKNAALPVQLVFHAGQLPMSRNPMYSGLHTKNNSNSISTIMSTI